MRYIIIFVSFKNKEGLTCIFEFSFIEFYRCIFIELTMLSRIIYYLIN